MRQRVTLYLCDPDKNRACSKTGCVYNPLAKYPCCRATTHPEFAKLGESGEPIQIPDWLERLKAEEADREKWTGEYHPYKLRLDITKAEVFAKYAFSFSVVSLILSAIVLLLR